MPPRAEAGADDLAMSGRSAGERRRRAKSVLRVAFVLVALGFAVAVVASEWQALGSRASELPVGLVGMAALCTMAAVGCSFLAWSRMLGGLGAPLPVSTTLPVFFIGQLGKYVPGSVWAFVAQMELGHAAKVRRERVAVAGVVVLLVSLATALVLALLVVPALLHSGPAYLGAVVLLVPLVVLLQPQRLDRVLEWALRLLRREPLDHPVSHRTLAEVALFALLNNALLGAAVWFLALHYGHGGDLLPLALGGYSLAAAVGLLAVPLPAGAGAREAALVLILAPALSDGAALLVAIGSRLLLVGADLVGAALATAVRRRTRAGELA